MTAIATGKTRFRDYEKVSSLDMAATASLEYKQGGIAYLDTSTGLIKNAIDTDAIPIGWIARSVTLGAGGGSVTVDLFYEQLIVWMLPDATDNFTAGLAGVLAYAVDDQTVASADATNTRPVFGRVLKTEPASSGTVTRVGVCPMRLENDNPALANLD